MRPVDEQLTVIEERAVRLRLKAERRRRILVDAAGALISALLLTAVVLFGDRFSAAPAEAGTTPFGSLLLATPGMRYGLIGLLAFALGVFVTLLCVNARRDPGKHYDR